MKKFLSLVLVVIAFAIPSFAKDKTTNYRNALVMAYSPANNVYEDDNIRLEIYDGSLWALNKTNKTVFIDLSQCFLNHNGSSYPMFSEHQEEKQASKKNVSTSIDQYISIAPAVGGKQNPTFICNLAGNLYGGYTTSESPSGNFSEYEERLLTLIGELYEESVSMDPKKKDPIGTVSRHLLEDETINSVGASIAYAFNKKAEDWNPVIISTWVSDVAFAPFYVEMPADLTKKEKGGFGVKKTEAAKIHIKADSPFEFDADKSPVLVFDWTGNIKKGTFDLNDTRISKKKGAGFGAFLLTVATGGMTAFMLNPTETFYKSTLLFEGENSDWGKLKYFSNKDLSKFDNK